MPNLSVLDERDAEPYYMRGIIAVKVNPTHKL
jgi:hypothetical protein